eukprot:g2305.t1
MSSPTSTTTTRHCFYTQVKPGKLKEYVHYHDHIWPEVVRGLRTAGVTQLTIFNVPETRKLVMYITTAGNIDLGKALGPGSDYRTTSRKCKEWEELMDADFHGGWTKMKEIHASDREWNHALKIPTTSTSAGDDSAGDDAAVATKIQDEEPLTIGQIAEESLAKSVLVRRLVARGMVTEVAAVKADMFRSAAKRLIDEGVAKTKKASVFWCPGRIEIAGKHTDYAGGRSLLCATTRGFAVVSVPRDDASCRIFTTFGMNQEKKSATLPVSRDLEAKQGHWTAYPATAIRRLKRNFDIKFGVDIALECDLPESSGMSSSSAVICYMFMVLAERNGVRDLPLFRKELPTEEALYTYLGFIENGQNCGSTLVGDRGVGTFGGSEDHTAIMSGEAMKLKMFSYCPTRHEKTVRWPKDLDIVVCVSGAKAEKTAGAMGDYNNAAFMAFDAARAYCEGTSLATSSFVKGRPNLAEIGDGNPMTRSFVLQEIAKMDDGKTIRPNGNKKSRCYEAGALERRASQFYAESEEIVPNLAAAFETGDVKVAGRLLDESHRLTVTDLRNTIPETAWLPDEARRIGALAATAFGAGFGGSCYAIVRTSESEAFAKTWKAAYNKKFPKWTKTSSFFAMKPSTGAFRVA